MIGPILVFLSWLLLRFEGKSLVVLGFDLPLRRAVEFLAGVGCAGLFATFKYLIQGYWSGAYWELNPTFSLSALFEGLRWVTNSVLYEELVFRGYLLYQAIRFLGARRACYLSAAVFGVYHWFSYGVLGSIVPMVFVFLLTGAFGLMLAAAFTKSGSLALPIGLHMGWNLVVILLFSDGPVGPQLLIASAPEAVVVSTAQALTTNLVLPLLLPAIVLWSLHRKLYRNGAMIVGEQGGTSSGTFEEGESA